MTRTVRILRGVGWAMIWAGLLILAFLAYQLWGTGLLTSAEQQAAADEVDVYFDDVRAALDDAGLGVPEDDGSSVRLSEDGAVDESSIVSTGPTFLTPEPEPDAGEAFAVITFPSLAEPDEFRSGDVAVDELRATGPSYVVRAGEDLPNLRRGPGHYVATPLPGQPGNAAIAGHRTTYGAPFNRLDELAAGDPILVETAIGTHVYVVRDPRTIHDEALMLDVGEDAGWMAVRANALWVVEPIDGALLTLTTCHPEFSSRQRLVVVAELVSGPNARYVAEEAA